MGQRFMTKEAGDGMFVFELGRGATPGESNKPEMDTGAKMRVTVNKEAKEIFSWGKKNDLPQRRESLVKSNNIVGQLIQTKRDITVGRGLMAYKESFEDGKRVVEPVAMPGEAEEFFERVNIYHFLLAAAQNLYTHANQFTEYVRTKDRNKIFSMRNLPCKHVRAEYQNENGRIENYFYSKNWIVKAGSRKRSEGMEIIPAYHYVVDDELPKSPKFVMHQGEELLSDDYYFHPMWWGGREWIETANNVPKFHNANFRNGYTLRWHIEYPQDYFKNRTSEEQTKDAKDKAVDNERQRKNAFINTMNELLAGLKNTGRAVFSSYEINRALGKDFPGIKVKPISADIKDEALLKLFEKSNQANISAQGIHPTLANIETQGKLSSGSEIRNAYLSYLAIKTPTPRKVLIEAIDVVKKANKWPKDVHFGFQDMEITNLDENPTAKQEVTSE